MFGKTIAMDVSKNLCDGEHSFFQFKEGCKVSCVKIVSWSIVAKDGTNTLIFYIFEYGAEYGAKFSAESGAKWY